MHLLSVRTSSSVGCKFNLCTSLDYINKLPRISQDLSRSLREIKLSRQSLIELEAVYCCCSLLLIIGIGVRSLIILEAFNYDVSHSFTVRDKVIVRHSRSVVKIVGKGQW